MAVSVHLDFVPPNDLPDLTKLHIYEGPTVDGPFAEIEVVNAPNIGVAPNYISQYTTALATSASDWFTVAWEDSKGALTDQAEPQQGTAMGVPYEIVRRVLLRDPSANEEVAFEEAQAVVEEIYGNINPDPALVTAKKMSGMTILTMARIQLGNLIRTSTSTSSWSAGLVSMKSGDSTQSISGIKELLVEASKMLGLRMSVVAQMALPEIAGGMATIVMADISRLQIDVA